jgi:3-methyladenine DNA glycosylase AlkC
MTDSKRIKEAVNMAANFADIDGGHHKDWVIDQMVRLLLGDGYAAFIAEFEEDGNQWPEGIAP